MRRNGYLWTSGVNLDTAVRFPDPDVLSECKISAIWWRFPLIFFILYGECPPYFYFRFVWPTDSESIPHASTPSWSTSIIPKKFEGDMTIHCRVIVFLSPDTSRDLVTLTFDLLNLNSWRTVTNLATKFKDPMPIRSWVMSYIVSSWLPLKIRTRPLRMRRITWPVSSGSKTVTFLESQTPICVFTIQLLLGTTTINGHFLWSFINAKAFDCVIFLCVTLWPLRLTMNSCRTWWVRSWVTSYIGSHWLPLKMRTRATAHVPNHATREKGVKNNYIFEIPDPDLPIHYTTFIGLRRRLRVVYSRPVEC